MFHCAVFSIMLMTWSYTKECQILPFWHHLKILVKHPLCPVFPVRNLGRKQQLTQRGISNDTKVNMNYGTYLYFFSDFCVMSTPNLLYIYTAVSNPCLSNKIMIMYFLMFEVLWNTISINKIKIFILIAQK